MFGYGSNDTTFAIPLHHAIIYPHVTTTGGSAESKLVYESIPQHTNVESNRTDASSKWQPLFCFLDDEFLPVDIYTMNFNSLAESPYCLCP